MSFEQTLPTHRQYGDGPIFDAVIGSHVDSSNYSYLDVYHVMQEAKAHALATGAVAATYDNGKGIRAEWHRVAPVVVEPTPEPEPDATFSLDAVVEGLQKRGIPAYVEQTGGGCATIYAGGMHVYDGDNRWDVAAGPGHFNGPRWTQGVSFLGEFSTGPNDEGESDCMSLPDTITTAQDAIEWAVAAIAEQVAITSHRTHADWNPASD